MDIIDDLSTDIWQAKPVPNYSDDPPSDAYKMYHVVERHVYPGKELHLFLIGEDGDALSAIVHGLLGKHDPFRELINVYLALETGEGRYIVKGIYTSGQWLERKSSV